MVVWFYREKWEEKFLTSPAIPEEEVKKVANKFKEEIDGASTSWGEIQFLYDGERIHPWKEEEEIIICNQ